MSDEVDRRLAAALRAQAGQASLMPSGAEPGRAGPGLAGWVVLAVAVLLGAVAGVLAGVISVW